MQNSETQILGDPHKTNWTFLDTFLDKHNSLAEGKAQGEMGCAK